MLIASYGNRFSRFRCRSFFLLFSLCAYFADHSLFVSVRKKPFYALCFSPYFSTRLHCILKRISRSKTQYNKPNDDDDLVAFLFFLFSFSYVRPFIQGHFSFQLSFSVFVQLFSLIHSSVHSTLHC